MGWGGFLKKIIGGGSKGPSAAELQAEQEAAARAERDRLAKETAGAQAAQQKKMAESETGTRQLAAGILDEETGKKKFLKGI